MASAAKLSKAINLASAAALAGLLPRQLMHKQTATLSTEERVLVFYSSRLFGPRSGTAQVEELFNAVKMSCAHGIHQPVAGIMPHDVWMKSFFIQKPTGSGAVRFIWLSF